ncbi:TEL2, telomere maintenance protein 2 [Clonorchis sinensis]|uniref:TEL2, telomere maintenance protein 2 n=1 Tax=Clonorchis sinensis TaxID=79923 RepID=A0A419PKH6_CLOSI|nr:TEL2, telomere maintenance protein 2 [Clonorchis sinensis]
MMTTLNSFLNSILLSSPELVDHSTLECLLTYPLHTAEFTFEITDHELRAFYEFDVYRVVHHVFSSYVAKKDARWSKLVQCAIELSKSDVVFRYLLDQLIAHTEEDWVSVVTNQLEKFVFNQERLSATFAFWSDKLRESVSNKPVEVLLRSLINLPSRFAGRRSKSKFLNRTAFVTNILSVFKPGSFDEDERPQLCGLLLSELALNGYASELAEFVLNDTEVQLSSLPYMMTQNTWSKALCHLKTNSMEPCLQPILSKSSHPFVVAVLFSRLLDGSNPSSLKILFKLFRRLLFVRYFPNDRLLRNLFGGLAQIVCQYLSSSNASQLVDMVNKELGLPLLHLWADSSAIQAASVEQRVYTSQALASWLTDFHSPVASKLSIKISDSLMLPDILSGISSHLASPRIEIRTIGMAVGEWLVSLVELPCADGQRGSLQFEYEDLEVVKRIKPLFVPFSAFPTDTTESTSVVSESDFTEKCQTIDPRSEKPTSDVDSDDEPDPLDPNHSSFVHLPRRSGQPKMISSVLSSNRKPRYLRECLDGMLCSKPEDNHISVACYTSAEELIYAHPNAARELVKDFAHVFVHMDLPSCPEESKLASCRHAALVALGTVAPKECARYLTSEFCQSTCSIGQRQNIISAITDIACQLSSDGNMNKKEDVSPSHADDSTPKSLISSKLVSQTRRFCSHRPPKPQTVNQFAVVAGEFFFPLLRSIPQLFAGSHTGTFAHQDAGLLANLVASLAVVYMCARLSSVQARMASELLELAPTLYAHREPAVRRAVLIAVGTVITTTPTSLLSANPQMFLEGSSWMHPLPASDYTDASGFSLASWLKLCSSVDNDSECKILASVGLSALMERSRELGSL